MRFTVIGTDISTGGETELTLDAMNADHAEYLAGEQGINVRSVRLGGGAAGRRSNEAASVANATPAETVEMRAEAASIAAPPAKVPERLAAPAARPEPVAAPAPAARPVAIPALQSAVVQQAAPPVAAMKPAEAAKPMAAPAVQQPSVMPTRPGMVTSPPADRSDRARSLGLVALALGGAGLMFCWIPVVGMISAPMCIAGAGAGAFGAWCAHKHGARSRSMLGQVALPLGGVALSTLSLCVAVLFAFGPTDGAQASNETLRQPPIVAVPTNTDDASPARSRTIVGSHQSGEAKSIFTPKAVVAAKPDAAAEPPPAIRVGAVDLAFVSARVENVQLIGDMGRPHGNSNEAMIVVKLAIRNVGESPVEYRTLAGDDNNLDARAATLTDERGVRYKRGQFDMGIAPAGRVPNEKIAPGRALTDTLVFHEPPAGCTELKLTLQCRAFGGTGTVEMKIPAGLIKR